MGYSIIKVFDNDITVMHIDVLKLPPKKDNYQRLQLIHQRVTELMTVFKPDEFAIEAPFFWKKRTEYDETWPCPGCCHCCCNGQ